MTKKRSRATQPTPPELSTKLAPAPLFAAGLGVVYEPPATAQPTTTQAWMVYDWLVHDALPSLLEAAELPELATKLNELPWCAPDPGNYHAAGAGIGEVNKSLVETMDTAGQLDARQTWGWSWGDQADVIERTGIPAAVLVVREHMARVTAGPPATTARLIAKLFSIPETLATAIHNDALAVLAALATTDPDDSPARRHVPKPPLPELLDTSATSSVPEPTPA